MKNKLLIIISFGYLFSNGISGIAYFEHSDDAFSLSRTYLTYKNSISDELSFKFQTDVGKVGDDDRFTAFLKKAQLDWKLCDDIKMSMGLIGMNMFNIQEKTWGNRFIAKSAMDINKFSSSADLGLSITKDFGMITANLMMSNGEGYKHMDVDDNTKMSLQLVHGEKRLNKKDGYNVGLVYSSLAIDKVSATAGSWNHSFTIDPSSGSCSGNNHDNPTDCNNDSTCNDGNGGTEQCVWTPADGSDGEDWMLIPEWEDGSPAVGKKTETVMGLFGGWSSNKLRIGAEYNTKKIATEGESLDVNSILTSLYLNYTLNNNLSSFFRLDSFDPNDDSSSVEDEVSTMMAGFIWNPTKGFTICPNITKMTKWDDWDNNPSTNKTEDSDNEFALNFQFKF